MGSAREAVRRAVGTYANGADRPLIGYGVLLTTYVTGVAGLGLVARRRGRLPERVSVGDIALLGVATHKLSRIVTKDAVTSTLRAPFTRFREPAGEGEVDEEVRSGEIRHAMGELVTCPFCVAQWIATGFAFGLVLAPRATRLAASVFAAVTASDALQLVYSSLKQPGD